MNHRIVQMIPVAAVCVFILYGFYLLSPVLSVSCSASASCRCYSFSNNLCTFVFFYSVAFPTGYNTSSVRGMSHFVCLLFIYLILLYAYCLKPVISTVIDRMFCPNHLPHSPCLPVVKVLTDTFYRRTQYTSCGFSLFENLTFYSF